MDQIDSRSDQVYRHRFTVPASAVDQNGHVNNVAYIQWMQDVATSHFNAVGGAAPMQRAGATWVVRSHNIEYLSPLYAGEDVTVLTWVANFRRVRSLRRYRFLRTGDGTLLARGETDWVFVDTVSGRPTKVPDEIVGLLPLLENE